MELRVLLEKLIVSPPGNKKNFVCSSENSEYFPKPLPVRNHEGT
jgi:hypothetical protein